MRRAPPDDERPRNERVRELTLERRQTPAERSVSEQAASKVNREELQPAMERPLGLPP